MKKIIPIVIVIAGLLYIYQPALKLGATILYPSGGGLGISTAPTYGQIPVGNTGGTYSLTATSSLGISATPGGSDPQVQFNDGGLFGGDIKFIYNKTTDRLGLGTTTPSAPLSIHANNGDTNRYLFSVASSTQTATSTFFRITNRGNIEMNMKPGDDNIGIGVDVMGQLTTGNTNIGIGYTALNLLTTGRNNIGIGAYAFSSLLGGIFNTAVGHNSGSSLTTGDENALLGYDSGQAITTGSGNTFSGVRAGNNTTVGSNNTGFGTYSLTGINTGSRNTSVGALTANNLTGSNNSALTLLGYASDTMSGVSVSTSTAIGHNARVGRSNSLILGDYSDTLFTAGVGTTSPFAKFSIHAFNGSLVPTLFAVASSTQTATTTLFSINNIGDVSIHGTTTPRGRLMVPMGEVNYFNTTGTVISIASQSDGSSNMVVVSPTTVLNAGSMEFDNGGSNNGRLRYTGTVTKSFHIATTISMDGEGAGTNVYVFGIAKNGTVGTCKILQSISASGAIGSTALHCFMTLATNDYLELYVGNTTDADDITAKSVNIFAMGM